MDGQIAQATHRLGVKFERGQVRAREGTAVATDACTQTAVISALKDCKEGGAAAATNRKFIRHPVRKEVWVAIGRKHPPSCLPLFAHHPECAM